MRAFRDRRDAGRKLAQLLGPYAEPGVVVLALPRGGVPVGYEIARWLGAPLDVLVVRKLGVPGHSELAMGAIASGGIEVIDPRTLQVLGITRAELEAVTDRERVELERRERMFRAGRRPVDVAGRTVILVDDGLATGSSMKAAVDSLRERGPDRIVVAVPIAPADVCEELRERADDAICLLAPDRLHAVGVWYEDFEQTTDAEVRALLDSAARPEQPEMEAR